MTSFFSPDGVVAIVAILTAAAGVVGFYLNRTDRRQEKDLEEQDKKIAAQKIDQAAALATQKTEFDSRLAGMKVDAKELEARLMLIERTYISRAEHAEFRAEMMMAVREVGTQVSRSIDNLGSKVEALVERVAKVEAGA